VGVSGGQVQVLCDAPSVRGRHVEPERSDRADMSEAKHTPGPWRLVDLKEAEYLDAWTSRLLGQKRQYHSRMCSAFV
jgi:hypothetical protein